MNPPFHTFKTTHATLWAFCQLMRLDKPIGSFLLLWPTVWALLLATNGQPPMRLVLIFVAGVFIMRTAGCVLNDIVDRHLDVHVTRTQHRPLVRGTLSVKAASCTLIILLSFALVIALQLNMQSFFLCIGALALTGIYPFMKRYTHFPQVVLGMAFNAGILLVFSETQHALPFTAWLLYGTGIVWSVAYDTLYAMVDKADDLKIGVKSTAVLFGDAGLLIVTLLYAGITVSFFWISFLNDRGGLFMLAILFALIWISVYLWQARSRLTTHYFQAFLKNNEYGLCITLGLWLDYFYSL